MFYKKHKSHWHSPLQLKVKPVNHFVHIECIGTIFYYASPPEKSVIVQMFKPLKGVIFEELHYDHHINVHRSEKEIRITHSLVVYLI